MARKDAPLDQLVARLRCDRSLSRTPLVQAAFSHYDAQGELALPGCSVRPLEVETGTAKFDFSLQLIDRGERVTGYFEYASDLFDEERIQRITRHYCTILDQLVKDASVAVGGSWLFGATERAEIARLGRGVTVDVRGDLLASIEHQFTHSGQRIAVVDGTEQTTYAELAAHVNRIAALLDSRTGRGEDALVAVCAGRSCTWIAAVLAILRLGCGYLPVDPQTPGKRALQALRESGVGVLLYAAQECEWAGSFEGRALDLALEPSGIVGATTVRASRPERIFYAITTSGSTGTPKTAAVSYRGFANLHAWYCNALSINADSRILVATSVAFDLTQKNLFAALANGARLVLRSEGNFDPAEVRNLVEEQQISVLNCTPSLFYPLIESCNDARFAQLASLRHVVLGGEPIDLAKTKRWTDHRSCRARMLNSYGPTECTDVCAACEINTIAALDATAPIGRPIPNVVLRVLDSARQLVPLGTPGELYISGAALGLGYLGVPSTARDGFVQLDSGRAYRTGDVVRYRWDGQLEFLGRLDNQIKVRGYRVNLEEVEAALRKHPRITDAVVTTTRTGETVGAMHAYYVADHELDRSELRYWLTDVLPRYMVPSSFTWMSALPLTRSGKIDRLRLPEPRGEARRAPRGDLELALHALWQQLLGITELGVEDNFFNVGGHSLMAIRLAEEIELKLRRACRVADVFERPTIQELAELLNGRVPETSAEHPFGQDALG